VRGVSSEAPSCSWATLETRASGERRSWGRAVDGDAGVVAVSAEWVRARSCCAGAVVSEGCCWCWSSLLLGVRSGRVGFMALRPAGVVRAGLSLA